MIMKYIRDSEVNKVYCDNTKIKKFRMETKIQY